MEKGKDYIGVGCGAVILNDKNQILLMKRTENVRNNPFYWSIPGGGVDFFESLEECIKRELKEELNIEIEVVKLLCVCNHIIKNEKQHWVAPQFLCKIIGGEIKNMEPDKCSEIKWFDLDDMPDPITDNTRDGVEVIKNKLKS